MRLAKFKTKIVSTVLAAAFVMSLLPGRSMAQDQAPPFYSPDQLDRLVSRVALYPDPLLAQVLAAATFPDQIPDAARWADQHHYLRGAELANAINEDRLPFDPSVQAVLPFPSVLDMMASDMNWTSDIGNAFLAQRQDVMDAVQRMRQRARDFGYLRSNGQIIVSGGPYIEIVPANPAFIPVPYYDPLVVYARPRAGFFVGGAIGFGYGVAIGTFFRPWGWGYSRFDWRGHGYYVNDRPWGRSWGNRGVYVHEYRGVQRWDAGRRAEGHELVGRNEHERNAWREGRGREEEHDHGRDHDHGHRP
jgi:Protein of unknown function (DUF3300)